MVATLWRSRHRQHIAQIGEKSEIKYLSLLRVLALTALSHLISEPIRVQPILSRPDPANQFVPERLIMEIVTNITGPKTEFVHEVLCRKPFMLSVQESLMETTDDFGLGFVESEL